MSVVPNKEEFAEVTKPTSAEIVSFPNGEAIPTIVKTLPPPQTTTNWFAHVTKIPVAQQPIKLLDMPQPMQQQQQHGGRLKLSESERDAIHQRQLAAQKAAMHATP